MSSSFHNLTPQRVIELTETVLDLRAQPVCRPLTSYINRVYEVHLEDGGAVVAKFYRPGRWTEDALMDEHDFVFELEEAGVPVVAPLLDPEGESLFQDEDLWFAIYPRRGGRPFEDPDDAQWQELGRTLARLHNVGDEHEAEHRLQWHPEESTRGHLGFILRNAGIGTGDLRRRYEQVVEELIDAIAPLFDDADYTRIHGDCHVANLMRRPDEAGIFLIDFDDMCYGPPVQDLWMLLPGMVADCRHELDHLLYGYRQLRAWDMSSLRLVEPLRAMRFIHFTAWCVQQQKDGGLNRLAEDFGDAAWWRQELAALERQRQVIRDVTGL